MNTGHDDLDRIATGCSSSRFAGMVERHLPDIRAKLSGRRVCVLGGAGSIGRRFTIDLLGLAPAEIMVCDKDENGLTELTRDIRGTSESRAFKGKLDLYCFDITSPRLAEFIRAHRPEVILNFAALKHVRSEKHALSVRYMVDTNVMALRWLIVDNALAGVDTFFSISTDKAASPANIMGTTKRLGEYLMGHAKAIHPRVFVSSTRFANVAYSNGSILRSIVMRLRDHHVFGVPANIRRFFISHAEASQICLLSLLDEIDGAISIPREEMLTPDRPILDLAQEIVAHFGFEPHLLQDEDEARHRLPQLMAEGRFPIVVTGGDTVGEKPFEVFHASSEPISPTCEPDLLKVIFPQIPDWARFDAGLSACLSAERVEDIAARLKDLVPEFHHLSSSRHLDQGV